MGSSRTSMSSVPVLGEPAAEGMLVTDVLSSKLRRLIRFEGARYLDVGCGNGSFTAKLGRDFQEVYGIDVEMNRILQFKRKLEGESDTRTCLSLMSAERTSFPDHFFDVVTAIEVFDHIPDLEAAARELARILKPGGFLGITCPNRLFPFETHGIRWRGREIWGRVPLLPYIPFLHRRYALARVFTVRALDRLLTKNGLFRTGLDYAFPTFERGSRLGRWMRPFRGLMRLAEESPLRTFGVSIVAAYQAR
jgi:SAM-dependent methyltransferase